MGKGKNFFPLNSFVMDGRKRPLDWFCPLAIKTPPPSTSPIANHNTIITNTYSDYQYTTCF